MNELAADAFVITHLPNVFYLCGFTGSNAALVILRDSLHLFTDSRYTIQSREEAPNTRVHIGRGSVAEQAGSFLRTRVARRRISRRFGIGPHQSSGVAQPPRSSGREDLLEPCDRGY